ncbi:transposase [bacterium]|nr:transposase [bacterium]
MDGRLVGTIEVGEHRVHGLDQHILSLGGIDGGKTDEPASVIPRPVSVEHHASPGWQVAGVAVGVPDQTQPRVVPSQLELERRAARCELPDGELFDTLVEARILAEWWRRRYNIVRPRGSPGYQPATPEGRAEQTRSTRLQLVPWLGEGQV